jgi:GMP synthase (glutamine-hydrolysing)
MAVEGGTWEASVVLAVVNNRTHFLAEMEEALGVIGVEYELIDGGALLTVERLGAYSGFILTGGPVHVYEPEQLVSVCADTQVLKLATVPVLGICLGHQLIAHHYGALIEPMAQSVDRVETIEIVRDDPVFEGVVGPFRARVAHDDAVVGIAPPLIGLARSAIGEYEVIGHLHRPVYGLQFHPEVSTAPGLTILRNFVALCQQWATARQIESA